MHERITKSIQYADNKSCRSLLLVHYLGEKSDKTCGICDVCLGRHKIELTPEDYQRYKEKILALLKGNPMNEKKILTSFSYRHHGRVRETISFLIDEGTLEYKGVHYEIIADAQS